MALGEGKFILAYRAPYEGIVYRVFNQDAWSLENQVMDLSPEGFKYGAFGNSANIIEDGDNQHFLLVYNSTSDDIASGNIVYRTTVNALDSAGTIGWSAQAQLDGKVGIS